VTLQKPLASDKTHTSQRLEDEHTKVQPWREREELMETIFGKDIAPLHLSMTWKQIQEISNDPLGNIGAHTVNHFPLRQLHKKDLQYEITASKKELEEKLGCAVEHFAYPFGKALEADRREFEIIKQLGFKTATTTRIGNIFPQHKNHLACLPRISINEVTKHSVLHLQTSGLLPFVVNKGKKIITH
ncbi:MAG: polysaccharide deacetylase family protein, partial [Bacteroidota bacterium]